MSNKEIKNTEKNKLDDNQNLKGIKIEKKTALLKNIKDYKIKADNNWNLYIKEKADMENLKKRMDKELNNIKKYSLKNFSKDLLNILDSIEHGMMNEKDKNNSNYKGLVLIKKTFSDILEKYGIKKIEINKNTKFNPTTHEVISVIEDKQLSDNTVLNVIQNGYILYDHVLRYAKVIISKNSKSLDRRTK